MYALGTVFNRSFIQKRLEHLTPLERRLLLIVEKIITLTSYATVLLQNTECIPTVYSQIHRCL